MAETKLNFGFHSSFGRIDGDPSKLLTYIFRLAILIKPSVLLLDELDSVFSVRKDTDSESIKRMKNSVLMKFTGYENVNSEVLVIGCTNIPFAIDVSVRRRFEKQIMIGLPEEEDIIAILKYHLQNHMYDINEESLKSIAESTKGYSCNDLRVLVKQALHISDDVAKKSTHCKEVNGFYYICSLKMKKQCSSRK